ncbi:hypothetical protein DYB32_009541, partial [Aphanomyces invadans]
MDDSSNAMELKLQQNLLKQHENYARQKELLQKLKMQSEATARNLSMPLLSKSPVVAPSSLHEESLPSPVNRDKMFHVAAPSPRPLSSSLIELAKDDQRIQDIYSQELVNDGLRKQLELIRRLESDNSRLRSETGTLRTQVTLLEDRSKLKERELARQAADLEDSTNQLMDLRQDHHNALQQGQETQHALAKVTRVKDALEEELRAALDTQRRLHERSHVVEREVDEAKGREAALLAHTKALEATLAKHEATIRDLQHDTLKLQETLAQKSDQCTAVQASATSCVEHIEANLKAVQDNLARESDKRRSWEAACHTLEAEVESLKANDLVVRQTLDSVRDLRDRNAALEEKLPYYHQLELDNKDMHAKLLLAQRDREEHERLVVQMKHGIWQTTSVLKKEFEAVRAYVASMEEEEGIMVEDTLRSVLHHFKHDLVHLSKRMVEGREKEQTLKAECNHLQQKLVALRHDMKELERQLEKQKELYAIAESAREMSTREKRDLLLWSRATCQKTERMASEVDQWEQFTIQQTTVQIAELKYTSYAELRSSWEQALQCVLQEAHQCHVKCNQETHRANKETKRKLELQRRLDAGDAEWQKKCAEKDTEMQAMQLRHTSSLQTLQDQHRCLVKENDTQIATLTHQVEDLTVKWNACEHDRQILRDQYAILEAQAPLYTGIAHMFAVCVRPMVLQISELQTQKRILTHQLGQMYAQQKEMDQIAALFHSTELKKPLKVTFRAAALAVFASNRLRNTSRQYGRNEALGLVFPQQIGVVKLLPLSSVQYTTQTLLQLENNNFVEKWTRLAHDTSSLGGLPTGQKRPGTYSHSGVGELVLSTLAAIDPSGECVVTNTLQGHASFLCDLHPVRANDKKLTVDVHRIRREVVEWMKKVENLQFQRTALQKENYALQSQIHEKDFELREMHVLSANAQELQEKLAMYQTQDGHGITLREFEACVAACKEAEARCDAYVAELDEKKQLAKELQSQLDVTTGRNKLVEEQLDTTRQALLEEEEAVVSLKSVVARYEGEMRQLTQAAHSVQSQFQQRCTELESDKLELNALSALLHETQRKNQSLED